MSRPIKMIREPRRASAAAMSNMSTTLSRQITFAGHLLRMLHPRCRALGRLSGPRRLGHVLRQTTWLTLGWVSAGCGLVPGYFGSSCSPSIGTGALAPHREDQEGLDHIEASATTEAIEMPPIQRASGMAGGR